MRSFLLVVVAVLLLAIWLGPLPVMARESFTAHMTMHMGVVAVVAPLLAVAMAGTSWDPIRRFPVLAVPIVASIIELVVVWTWHTPAMHLAARHDPSMFALEQAAFLLAGAFLWISALGGSLEQRRLSAGSGVVGLVFTSMHMTLLGALLALTNRPLFQHGAGVADARALSDQHLGGAIMLLVGGTSYLAGGLYLTGRMLASASPERPAACRSRVGPDEPRRDDSHGRPQPIERQESFP
jgi:putative membrane protein